MPDFFFFLSFIYFTSFGEKDKADMPDFTCMWPKSVTDAKELQSKRKVEKLREKVCESLAEYCEANYEEQPDRSLRTLMLMLPLRSISMDCKKQFQTFSNSAHDAFLRLLSVKPDSASA